LCLCVIERQLKNICKVDAFIPVKKCQKKKKKKIPIMSSMEMGPL